MADIDLNELKRRLLAGQENPDRESPRDDVFVAPSGDIRVGRSTGTAALSKVPKKVFATGDQA